MSIGELKQFEDLDAGQWFVLPDLGGIGWVIQIADEKRPVVFSSSEAKTVSPASIRGVYAPEVKISPDSLSLSEHSPQAGSIILAPNGTYIQFAHNGTRMFADLKTGTVGQPGSPAVWFKKWSLLEKKPTVYASLLDFGS